MGSPDSWDAFDAKMFRSKGPAKKDVHNQFLELSSSQNKSLNVADEDFSTLSFQDARNLIEKDENERLQFMNSNISFSDGIEQMEAPSLLSVTNYFQQGSSFPVPCLGNDSTMFGVSRTDMSMLPPINDSMRSQRRSSANNHSISRHSRSSRTGGAKEDKVLQQVNSQGTSSRSTELSRNDSLAKFFLGPESDGLDKMNIMDYVLDYCKRRASLRLSDASDIAGSLNNSSNNTTPERHDSGIGIGGDDKHKNKDKTVIKKNDLSSHSDKKERKDKGPEKENSRYSKYKSQEHGKTTLPISVCDKEESIVVVDGAAVQEADVLDVSDVGGIDGFEKFKKNLHRKHKDDRFRGKMKHHEDFEKKRLNVDERNSHPRLSSQAFSGPGATATMERPSKKLPCNRDRDIRDTSFTAVKQSTPREDMSVVPVTHSSIQKQQQSSNESGHGMKQSNPQLEGLSVMPVIHSAIQQQQYNSGSQTCSCPHHCGQQQNSQGLIPNGGAPIVIHIHLPCASATSGTVAHPVPTTSSEKM